MLIKDTLTQSLAATKRQILWLFLTEAAMLSSLAGAVLGVILGYLTLGVLQAVLPGHSDGTAALPVELAWSYLVAAFVVSLLIGIAAGVAPAMKAVRLELLEALRTE